MIDDYQIVELERRVAWQPLDDYPEDGEAQIAETSASGRRLIVRRTRLIGPQAELWPDWRYFPFITNRSDPLELVESEHRQHAVAERSLDASVIRRKECPARLVPGLRWTRRGSPPRSDAYSASAPPGPRPWR
jgi:hypothetical protein